MIQDELYKQVEILAKQWEAENPNIVIERLTLEVKTTWSAQSKSLADLTPHRVAPVMTTTVEVTGRDWNRLVKHHWRLALASNGELYEMGHAVEKGNW